MTGGLPFHEYEYKTDLDIMMAIANGRIPRRASPKIVEDHIWDIWVSCWSYDPQLRPSMKDIVWYIATYKVLQPNLQSLSQQINCSADVVDQRP